MSKIDLLLQRKEPGIEDNMIQKHVVRLITTIATVKKTL